MAKRSDISDAEVIEAVRLFQAGEGETPDLALSYPPKVTLAKMRQMVDRSILDYGVSLRTAWLL